MCCFALLIVGIVIVAAKVGTVEFFSQPICLALDDDDGVCFAVEDHDNERKCASDDDEDPEDLHKSFWSICGRG